MLCKRFSIEDMSLKRFLGPLFFSAAVCYLAFHALNGERGLYAYLKQSRNLEVSQQKLAKFSHERKSLENRVHLLSDDSLDLDLLDEQARRILGTSNKQEIVVILDPKG
ncbi:MAG: septum formation initiator family protein [Alphaproteobacteria bacterium]|nr:septum formation initiator family protein [Alphaproteobacteria bacterium]